MWQGRLSLSLVVDASVGLKWVLDEPGSEAAHRLGVCGEALLMPDFWLNEAANVLWMKVRRGLMTAERARSAFERLRAAVPVVPTHGMGLQRSALSLSLDVNHSVYDTIYVAFALLMNADRVVLVDDAFVKALAKHPEPRIAGILWPLDDWARANPA